MTTRSQHPTKGLDDHTFSELRAAAAGRGSDRCVVCRQQWHITERWQEAARILLTEDGTRYRQSGLGNAG